MHQNVRWIRIKVCRLKKFQHISVALVPQFVQGFSCWMDLGNVWHLRLVGLLFYSVEPRPDRLMKIALRCLVLWLLNRICQPWASCLLCILLLTRVTGSLKLDTFYRETKTIHWRVVLLAFEFKGHEMTLNPCHLQPRRSLPFDYVTEFVH